MCAFILGIAQFGSQVQKLGAELTINQKQQCDNEVQQYNSDEYKKKNEKKNTSWHWIGLTYNVGLVLDSIFRHGEWATAHVST